MKEKAFEASLPDGYRQALYINAKSPKIGIVFSLISFAIFALVMLIALLPLPVVHVSWEPSDAAVPFTGFALVAALILYTVLHELVHGAAYKRLTGEKPTFGISWSCAFCGVPNIYTYRKASLISVCAPLVLFTLILLPLTVILYFVHPLFYLASAIVLASHLGGCSGDMYVMLLLLTKFKDDRVLMRDTGPEQFFYVPDQENKK